VLDSVIKEVQTRSVSLWEGFNTAKSAIIAANSAVEAAQIACDGTTHEEKVGNKTILDVLTAQKNLYDTKVKKIATYKGLIITAYQLKSLSGMLTARALDLHVDYFVPEEEFKKLKKRLFVDKIF
jgi:outer membrane protein